MATKKAPAGKKAPIDKTAPAGKKASTDKTTPAGKKAPVSKKAPAKRRVTERAIRKRAEEIYLKRMKDGSPGNPESDWLKAEQELRNP